MPDTTTRRDYAYLPLWLSYLVWSLRCFYSAYPSRAVLCRRRKVPLLMAHCTDSRLSEALTRADDQLGPRSLRADSDDWPGSKAQG